MNSTIKLINKYYIIKLNNIINIFSSILFLEFQNLLKLIPVSVYAESNVVIIYSGTNINSSICSKYNI